LCRGDPYAAIAFFASILANLGQLHIGAAADAALPRPECLGNLSFNKLVTGDVG
jgi:hypothetical protein